MARPTYARKADDEESVQERLTSLIAECATGADSIDAAADALRKAVRADRFLYDALMDSYEGAAARAAVRVYFRAERRGIWSAAPQQWERPAGPDSRVGALAHINTVALMNFRLPGGLPIGKATEVNLREGAQFYATHSADMAWKSKWLDRVAAALPEGKVVAEAFSEADLVKMREAVR